MSKIESNGHTSPPIENPRKPFATSELRDSSQELKLLREQNAALQAEVEHLKAGREVAIDWMQQRMNEQLAIKDAEIEQWKARAKIEERASGWCAHKDEADCLRTQLAASQANEVQLREALSQGCGWAPIGSTSKSIMYMALALPSDTTALEAMIQKAGEVMRERCESMLRYQGGFNIDLVRALPGVTMDDLKGGAA